MKLNVQRVPAGAAEEALAALLPLDGDLPYANFSPIAEREGALFEFHRRRWLAPQRLIAHLVACDEATGRTLGCARLDERPFESGHFGLGMALLDRPLAPADPALREAVLAGLVREASRLLRELGFAHLAVRLSAEDGAGAWALQEQGARHVGTQVSWTCALDGRSEPWSRPDGLRLEPLDAGELRRLPSHSWKRLADWSAHGFLRGPFLFDHTLPAYLSRQTYLIWMERVMAGEWADAAMVAFDDGEVVAVISMQLVQPVSEIAGLRIFGRSLAVTLPGYRGLCTGLMCDMIARRPFDADYMEGDTPVTTFGTINMFAKVGFRYLRATSSFHQRLDAA